MSAPVRVVLPLPPSINSYHRSVPASNGGRKVLVSREGRAWKKRALQIAQMQRPQKMDGEIGVVLTVFFRDKRRDLDNAAKPCLDLLQDAGFFENDRQVWHLEMRRETDRGNPRVEVEIRQLAA